MALDHAAMAAGFALAIQEDRHPAVVPIDIKDHLLVLHHLINSHSLEACRRYAAEDCIPWGRFKKFDELRWIVLHAPRNIRPGMVESVVANRASDLIVCPRPGATRVVLVFTGAHHQFGGPLRLIHRWLAQLDASLIYLIDNDWSYYLGPMRGLGGSMTDKAEALNRIIGDLGATSCFCLGTSGGGFGALVLAPYLGAKRVLAYSPPTVLRESLPAIQRKVPGLDPLLSPEGTIDIADLRTRHDQVPPTKIYYPADNAHDLIEAENLRGVPGVELRPLEGETDHNLMPRVISRGLFGLHLDWLVRD